MQIKLLLEKINNWGKPYHTLILMVTCFIATPIALYNIFFKAPDLSVFINKQEVNFPNSVNQKYLDVYNYIATTCKDSTIAFNARETYEYLQNTNNFWTITMQNETSKSIKGIRILITDVASLSEWAINGDYLLDEEKNNLLKKLKYEPSNGVISLNKIELLPPHSKIKLYIWGKFPNLTFDQNVHVNYEDGDGHIGYETTVYGFKAIACDYLYEFIGLFFFTFFIIWRNMKKKIKNDIF